MTESTGKITSWHSYPSSFALGHKALGKLLSGPVLIEEKIDGSQFSFGLFEEGLKIRSKGKEIFLEAPEKMFNKAIETVLELKDKLTLGWTYRAEYLQSPKHNCLAYDRHPNKHVIIFDINDGHESYLSYQDKFLEAERLGLECVPKLFEGELTSYEQFQSYLQTISVLGGQKIEGVVVKNYSQFGPDKKVLIGKFVSEEFKEVHANEWKLQNPAGTEGIIEMLTSKYKTPARWAKAVQHMREAGKINGSPQDIGLLLKEVGKDLIKECEAEIIEDIKAWAIPKLTRACIRGFPEWYKEQLAKAQFDTIESVDTNG